MKFGSRHLRCTAFSRAFTKRSDDLKQLVFKVIAERAATRQRAQRRRVRNGTARIWSAADTDVVSNQENPKSSSNVQSGDVLVSHPTAVREHEISIVPNAPHATSPTHDAAVSDGRSEADVLGVDAWLTEDHTHVLKIASNRTPAK